MGEKDNYKDGGDNKRDAEVGEDPTVSINEFSKSDKKFRVKKGMGEEWKKMKEILFLKK